LAVVIPHAVLVLMPVLTAWPAGRGAAAEATEPAAEATEPAAEATEPAAGV
jgi:hypothetical protein